MRISPQSIVSGAIAALTLTISSQSLAQSLTSAVTLSPSNVSCKGNEACGANTSSTGTLSFSQFSADTGVLVGVSFEMTTPSGALVNYTSSKSGSATYTETVDFQGKSLTSRTQDLDGGSSGAALSAYPAAASFSDLSGFVGTGTLTGSVTGTLSATRTGAGTATASVSSHASVGQLTYDYRSHANASFSATADSDAASLAAGSVFTLTNWQGDHEAAGLGLTDILCTGDCQAFSLGADNFKTLAGKASNAFTTALLATKAGQYSAHYTLVFSDVVEGGLASTLRRNAVTLDLTGQVAAVPEPESAALFMAGLLALGGLGRRRSARR